MRPGAVLTEILVFWTKAISACLFGITLVALILATNHFYPDTAPLARYDFLFLCAVLIQIALITFRLETWAEVRMIAIFHITGTVMELFKTHPDIASWHYPEDAVFRIYTVPLFSGFMYASVGSFIARSWRLFDFRFVNYPAYWVAFSIAIAAYLNFFAHHFIWDMRWVIMAAVMIVFGRTWIAMRLRNTWLHLPLIAVFVAIALMVWMAENFSSYGNAWLYPHQEEGWSLVKLSKLGSWFLLMILSFVLVSLVNPTDKPPPKRAVQHVSA